MSTVIALYAYEAQGVAELSFAVGDTIRVLIKHEDGWWEGEHDATGQRGWLPGSFVEGVAEKPASLPPAEGWYQLGLAYAWGMMRQAIDYDKAELWLLRAAEAGHADAMAALGTLHRFTLNSASKGDPWLKRAMGAGSAFGRATCLANGLGVPVDMVEAVPWYAKGAEQGDPVAQYSLAFCYQQGRGVTQDYGKAIAWYEKAAAQGHASAQRGLGLCYQHGRGVAQDFRIAVSWYKKAAAQGRLEAINDLGCCYQSGHGVARDYDKAMAYYEQAAAQGSSAAQCNLGNCYQFGYCGVARDYGKAIAWYEKAAAQGHASAQRGLDQCHRHEQSVAKSAVEEVALSEMAAQVNPRRTRRRWPRSWMRLGC